MTVEDLNMALAPVIEAIEKQPTLEDLQELIEVLEHQAQVQYGIIVALGVVAGLLMIYLLLHKF